MDDDVRAFGTELGRKALARDWPAVQAMLATWMRSEWPIERVQAFFEDEYRSTLEAKLQLQCSDEQMESLAFDFFCEVWMAVVDTAEGLRVGYWSQGAY